MIYLYIYIEYHRHGGGFALCGNNTHRAMVAQFAAEGLILCAPNYRRPPEVSIIDAVDDCLATYRYLLNVVGIPSSRISVMGDSAGGALTVLLLCRIRDMNDIAEARIIPNPPGCAVLLSPWVELEDETIISEADKGNIMPDHDFLPRDALVMISRLVVGKLSPKDPQINPMSARLDRLPKLLIHVGELELLFDQVTRFYEKIRDEGGEVKMKIWIDGVHVPHVFTAVSEEARIAVNDAANFIKQNT
jgi:monoterpene epsilon-lactone hydrolase